MKSNKLLNLMAHGGAIAGGARIGSAFGPLGTAVGAAAGYAAGLLFSSDDDAPSSSNFTKEELEQKIKSANSKSTKKLAKIIDSLNSNKGSQDLQVQQQYQASQQQFMMMMLLFSQNQKPALEAGQNIAREELREIKQSLKDAEKQNKELLEKIRTFEEEKKNKEQEKEGIQTEINQLDQDLADKKIEEEEHKQKVAILRQQEQVAQTRIDEILVSVASLQTELQNCSTNKDELKEKEVKVQTSLENYQQQINQLADNLNTVATQHNINRQVPIVNIDSQNPFQSKVNALRGDYSDSHESQESKDPVKEWFQEAKPYLKWGGIGLAIIIVVSTILKLFASLMRMF